MYVETSSAYSPCAFTVVLWHTFLCICPCTSHYSSHYTFFADVLVLYCMQLSKSCYHSDTVIPLTRSAVYHVDITCTKEPEELERCLASHGLLMMLPLLLFDTLYVNLEVLHLCVHVYMHSALCIKELTCGT